jgi:hypothetical protein
MDAVPPNSLFLGEGVIGFRFPVVFKVTRIVEDGELHPETKKPVSNKRQTKFWAKPESGPEDFQLVICTDNLTVRHAQHTEALCDFIAKFKS